MGIAEEKLHLETFLHFHGDVKLRDFLSNESILRVR